MSELAWTIEYEGASFETFLLSLPGLGNPTAVTLGRLASALDLTFSLVPVQR